MLQLQIATQLYLLLKCFVASPFKAQVQNFVVQPVPVVELKQGI